MTPRIGIVTNPASHRNKAGLEDIEAAIAGRPDIAHATLSSMSDLPAILADFAAAGVGVVVPNGGDGTVVAVLTELFENRPFDPMPRIAVLPRGLTNMIADDVGLQGRAGAALVRLSEACQTSAVDRHLVRRRLIRMDGARGHRAQVGLFFGAAGLTRAILACRKVVHRRGLGAKIAGGMMLAKVLAGNALGLSGGDDVFRGDPVDVALDGDATVSGAYLMILVTTLDHMLFRSRPFWGTRPGALRYTAVRYPPRKLLRAVWPLMYGGADRRLPNDDYVSENAGKISLTMSCPFTLDGEMFEPDTDRPVILSGEHEAEFIRL